MISRWPSTRTTSTMPDSRMKIHEYISKLLRRPRTRLALARGASMPRAGKRFGGGHVALPTVPMVRELLGAQVPDR